MAIDVQLAGRIRSATPYTALWTKQSGPSTISFVDATNPTTSVHITGAGDYVLKLTADNGEFTNFDTMTIFAHANVAPVANAGPDRTAVINNSIVLAGSATDDGYPNPPGAITYTWSKVSGTGTVVFSPSSDGGVTGNVATPSVSINTAGTFVLRLTASDSLLSHSDDMTVVVTNDPGGKYAKATPDAVSGATALTDVEFLVDMSAFDNTWWTAAQTSSAGVRVTTNNSAVLLPCDVIRYDKAAKTGLVVYKRSTAAAGAGEEVRVWTGPSSGAVALAADDTNGRYNAYSSATLAFWPFGGAAGEIDRTRNLRSLSNSGTITSVNGWTATAAIPASRYSDVSYSLCMMSDLTAPCTLSACTNLEGVGGGVEHCLLGLARTQGGVVQSADFSVRVAVNGSSEDCLATIRNSSTKNDSTATKFGTGWKQYGAVVSATGATTAVTLNATGSTTGTIATAAKDQIVLGAFPKLTPNENYLGGGSFTATTNNLALVSVWNVAHLAGTLKYREQMLDQTTFWNGWITV